VIINSTIAENTANADGGGGVAKFGPDVTITNSTISGNTAEGGSLGGGGIINETGFFDQDTGAVPTSTVRIINSTIAGNKADDTINGGGGILNIGPGTVTITSSTIARNRAVTSGDSAGGGGIFNRDVPGEVTVVNTIVTQNVGTGGAGFPNTSDCGGRIINAGHNISNGISCGFGEGDNTDPLLDTSSPTGLQDNGGPTQKHVLRQSVAL